jgi:hypothetical protein
MHAITAADSHQGPCLSFICKHKHLWNADIMPRKVEKTQEPLAYPTETLYLFQDGLLELTLNLLARVVLA